MKTIYSLKEFREQVLEIAKLADETYATVSVEVDHTGQFEFVCYVNKYGRHSAKTMEESLAKLREKIFQQPIPDVDVMIEMPELQEFDGQPLN